MKFDIEQTVNTKTAEGEKTSFPKEPLENAHFYKPALINLKTTQK